jgi:hypothetical protein
MREGDKGVKNTKELESMVKNEYTKEITFS